MSLSPEQIAILQAVLPKAIWLIGLIVLHLATGVALAIKNHVFEWRKLADILADYGPKAIGWLALELIGLLPEELRVLSGVGEHLGSVAYAILMVAAAGAVLSNARSLGLLPEVVERFGLPDKSAQG